MTRPPLRRWSVVPFQAKKAKQASFKSFRKPGVGRERSPAPRIPRQLLDTTEHTLAGHTYTAAHRSPNDERAQTQMSTLPSPSATPPPSSSENHGVRFPDTQHASNAQPSRSLHFVSRAEAIKGISNRFVFSTFYIYLYLVMAGLS